MPRRAPLLAAVAALVAAAAACRDLPFEPQDPRTVTYPDTLRINLADPAYVRDTSGVYYRDLAVGGGAVVAATSTITYRYTGALADGRVFESNINATQPESRALEALIFGWQRGLLGMRAGGRRRLIIPPALGYGNTSRPTIPAGSVLIFDIDITSVTTPTT